MKHYILVWVDVPEPHEDNYSDWLHLSQHVAPAAKNTKGIEQLAPGVWLIPRDTGMTFASECIATAPRHNLRARARFLISDD